MGHVHQSAGSAHQGRLKIVFLLTFSFLVAEVVGAIWTNSLALLADAAHMLTDVGGLGLALFAIWFGARPSTPRKTFGYYRIEILAALLNGAVLLAVSAYVIYEAIDRFSDPPEISAGPMIVVALLGFAVNVIGIFLLRSGAEESLNVQGAFLEVVADMLGSVGVVIAGLMIWLGDWNWADPLFSIAIGLFIIPRTVRLMAKAVNVLMEGVPDGVQALAVDEAIRALPGVLSVHDLHIWSITSGVNSLSVHVAIQADHDDQAVLDRVVNALAEQFDIHHSTIQIERTIREERQNHDLKGTT